MVVKEKRYCLSCEAELKGRADQRFCDVACKNEFHNAALSDGEKVYKRVLKILRKNRQILKEVLGEKSSVEIEMSKLIGKGFDNDYLTHIKKSKINEYDYFYVFDYGYRKQKQNIVKVVRAYQ